MDYLSNLGKETGKGGKMESMKTSGTQGGKSFFSRGKRRFKKAFRSGKSWLRKPKAPTKMKMSKLGKPKSQKKYLKRQKKEMKKAQKKELKQQKKDRKKQQKKELKEQKKQQKKEQKEEENNAQLQKQGDDSGDPTIMDALIANVWIFKKLFGHTRKNCVSCGRYGDADDDKEFKTCEGLECEVPYCISCLQDLHQGKCIRCHQVAQPNFEIDEYKDSSSDEEGLLKIQQALKKEKKRQMKGSITVTEHLDRVWADLRQSKQMNM